MRKLLLAVIFMAAFMLPCFTVVCSVNDGNMGFTSYVNLNRNIDLEQLSTVIPNMIQNGDALLGSVDGVNALISKDGLVMTWLDAGDDELFVKDLVYETHNYRQTMAFPYDDRDKDYQYSTVKPFTLTSLRTDYALGNIVETINLFTSYPELWEPSRAKYWDYSESLGKYIVIGKITEIPVDPRIGWGTAAIKRGGSVIPLLNNIDLLEGFTVSTSSAVTEVTFFQQYVMTSDGVGTPYIYIQVNGEKVYGFPLNIEIAKQFQVQQVTALQLLPEYATVVSIGVGKYGRLASVYAVDAYVLKVKQPENLLSMLSLSIVGEASSKGEDFMLELPMVNPAIATVDLVSQGILPSSAESVPTFIYLNGSTENTLLYAALVGASAFLVLYWVRRR